MQLLSRSITLFVALAGFMTGGISDAAGAGEETNAAPKQGAALLKTDVMGVFAHPDDETGVAATLATYARAKKAVVANIYCTRGEGGGNMVGREGGAALGALREAELRDCLAKLGVRYCYFLDQLDWAYTESVAATLQKWGKDATLERLVRLVRLLRPEVMLTMNPAPRAGQHGHHQAAGVLATEAFTASADPNRFPLQLSKEGLSVWQPRKLYFSGSSTGVHATIEVNVPLDSGQTAAQVAAQALANHRSQAFGNAGNSPWLQRPQRFTLVRSFVPLEAEEESDLLRGLPMTNAPAAPVSFGPFAPVPLEVGFVPRPALARYREWLAEQKIQHVAAQFQTDLPLVAGEANDVQVRLANRRLTASEGTLRLNAPPGWQIEPAVQAVRLARSVTQVLSFRITPPSEVTPDMEVTAQFRSTGGWEKIDASALIHLLPRARVKRLKSAPALDGTERGWEQVPALTIAASNLWQGKTTDAADCSAQFRLGHFDRVLFLDVQVKDDVVVTNIEPNDIKGHWRSDSIEICLDPSVGAEHTMGCYKLGIFPFDTTGVVRAARDADARQGPVEETAPHTRLVSRRTPDGYRIQAAIPFDEIGVARGHKRLGFNLLIYDGDKRDAKLGENINQARLAWAPRAGVMGRPEDWGRLELE